MTEVPASLENLSLPQPFSDSDLCPNVPAMREIKGQPRQGPAMQEEKESHLVRLRKVSHTPAVPPSGCWSLTHLLMPQAQVSHFSGSHLPPSPKSFQMSWHQLIAFGSHIVSGWEERLPGTGHGLQQRQRFGLTQ